MVTAPAMDFTTASGNAVKLKRGGRPDAKATDAAAARYVCAAELPSDCTSRASDVSCEISCEMMSSVMRPK